MLESREEGQPSVPFSELADLFDTMNVFAAPAELHGILCGHLSASDVPMLEWLELASNFLEVDELVDDNARDLLEQIYKSSLAQLSGSGFGLFLMLPEDEFSIEQRAGELGAWCRGFLGGIAHADQSKWSQEATESLQDLSEIADIDDAGIEESEDTDRDLLELMEYVRMAAILLYTELHSKAVASEDAESDEDIPLWDSTHADGPPDILQ